MKFNTDLTVLEAILPYKNETTYKDVLKDILDSNLKEYYTINNQGGLKNLQTEGALKIPFNLESELKINYTIINKAIFDLECGKFLKAKNNLENILTNFLATHDRVKHKKVKGYVYDKLIELRKAVSEVYEGLK